MMLCCLPIVLFPVIGVVVLAKLLNAIAYFGGLKQQKLNDYQANLRLVTLMSTQCQAENQAINCNYIELPDHVVNCVYALVYKVTSIRRAADFSDQIVAELTQMRRQSACTDTLQNSYVLKEERLKI